MNNTGLLHFENPLWWLLPAAIVLFAAVYFLYSAKDLPWRKSTSYVLASVRFIALLIIAFLLLNPFINLISNTLEKPKVAVLVDNSTSMLQHHDSTELTEMIRLIQNEVEGEGYEVSLYDLEGKKNKFSFSAGKTDLAASIQRIREDFQGQNLGKIILLSDGINNRGFSPLYQTLVDPVTTIGFGDTIPPRDIGIVEARFNNIVYKGNQFPLEVLVSSRGFSGNQTLLKVLQGSSVVAEKEISLDRNQQVNFLLDAGNAGLNRYQIVLESVEGEEQSENNRYDFFVDVIEGKEKVLMVAPAPHPDIRAIRDALLETNNYETDLYIPGISELSQEKLYDVAIFHNALNRNFPSVDIDEDTPIWYIIDPEGRIGQTGNFSGVTIRQNRKQLDAVGPAFNSSFSQFSMEDGFVDVLSSYPSIHVPYGEYAINGPVDVFLYQKVGSITTSRPLLSFFDDGNNKSALLAGTGIWKWKLQEGAIEGNDKFFDQIVTKTIQLLSVKKDKRQFRIDPTRRVYQEGEKVRFTIETYNSIYERTGGNTIEVTIRNSEDQTYSYTFTSDRDNNLYTGATLPAGIYSYNASTKIGEKIHRESGEFLIKAIQLEKLNRVADHQLLREIARNSGGSFYYHSEIEPLYEEISSMELSGVIRTSQNFVPVINILWILVIVISLMSVEWFFRKYLGAY